MLSACPLWGSFTPLPTRFPSHPTAQPTPSPFHPHLSLHPIPIHPTLHPIPPHSIPIPSHPPPTAPHPLPLPFPSPHEAWPEGPGSRETCAPGAPLLWGDRLRACRLHGAGLGFALRTEHRTCVTVAAGGATPASRGSWDHTRGQEPPQRPHPGPTPSLLTQRGSRSSEGPGGGSSDHQAPGRTGLDFPAAAGRGQGGGVPSWTPAPAQGGPSPGGPSVRPCVHM